MAAQSNAEADAYTRVAEVDMSATCGSAFCLAERTGEDGSKRPVLLKRVDNFHNGVGHVREARLVAYFGRVGAGHALLTPCAFVTRTTHGGEKLWMEFPLCSADLEELMGAQALKGAATRCAVATGVVECIAHLHSLGVMHCDAKPSNFVLGRDGRVRLLDFNVAMETVDAVEYAAVSDTEAMCTAVVRPPEWDAACADTAFHPKWALSGDVFSAALTAAACMALYTSLTEHWMITPCHGTRGGRHTEGIARNMQERCATLPVRSYPCAGKLAPALRTAPGARPSAARLLQSMVQANEEAGSTESSRHRAMERCAAIAAAHPFTPATGKQVSGWTRYPVPWGSAGASWDALGGVVVRNHNAMEAIVGGMRPWALAARDALLKEPDAEWWAQHWAVGARVLRLGCATVQLQQSCSPGGELSRVRTALEPGYILSDLPPSVLVSCVKEGRWLGLSGPRENAIAAAMALDYRGGYGVPSRVAWRLAALCGTHEGVLLCLQQPKKCATAAWATRLPVAFEDAVRRGMRSICPRDDVAAREAFEAAGVSCTHE